MPPKEIILKAIHLHAEGLSLSKINYLATLKDMKSIGRKR